ncbi:MAG: cyclic nucleotide-binding domain-containing protein [Betaproteobacteria bacterium]|nr:cyclic nucleotide-binding domain-containing protein [Betaproteobacteria bacterium]
MTAFNPFDAFRATAICRDLDEAAAAQIFALAEPVSFLAGSRLVRQGETSRGAYLIRSGTIEVRVSLPGGGDKTVATLGDGSMFGEMALLEHGLCSASVVAVSNVDGWFIEHEPFRALTAGRNAAALAIQRTITQGLVERLGALNAELRKHPAPEDRPVAKAKSTVATDPLAGLPRTRHAAFAYRSFLPILPFFSGFSVDEIDAVTANARVLDIPRGHDVFQSAQAASACYLVVRGAVEACAEVDGRERRMALLGPGSLVGYLSVLRGMPHSADARAREQSLLLEFAADDFMAIYNGLSGAEVKMQHAIHRNLLQSLARSNSHLSRLVSQARLSESLKNRLLGVGI